MDIFTAIITLVAICGAIAFLIFIVWLVLRGVPSIAREQGENRLNWMVGTVATGIIPGVVAAFLHRTWNIGAAPAFALGLVAVSALGWVIYGMVLLFSN